MLAENCGGDGRRGYRLGAAEDGRGEAGGAAGVFAGSKGYGGIVGDIPDKRPIVYGPNKGKEPQNEGFIPDKKWLDRMIPGKIVEGKPRRILKQPPFKIIIGGKEYPAEMDQDGNIQIRF
jgi:hypothetical protein